MIDITKRKKTPKMCIFKMKKIYFYKNIYIKKILIFVRNKKGASKKALLYLQIIKY